MQYIDFSGLKSLKKFQETHEKGRESPKKAQIAHNKSKSIRKKQKPRSAIIFLVHLQLPNNFTWRRPHHMCVC